MRNQIQTAAFGLYLPDVDLQALVHDLGQAEFPHEDVCVVLPTSHPSAETLNALKTGTCKPDSVSRIQGVLSWLNKFGAVVIPTVGLFFGGNGFVGTLFADNRKQRTCNSLLHSLGIPQSNANRYEDWVKQGGSVVYVCCDDVDRMHKACDMLDEADAEEVSWIDEAAVYTEFGFQQLLQAC